TVAEGEILAYLDLTSVMSAMNDLQTELEELDSDIADAAKETAIREAQGEAEAILSIQTATAEGIRRLNEVAPGSSVVALKGFEALEKLADGKATKIIIPSELQGLAGLATSVKELIVDEKQDK
ncbi:MAG: peptidase, partial [Clostridia bacterium]|nr:peptidase [Clostridia bacterium]